MNDLKTGRFLKLEEKAKDEYLSNTDWAEVINSGLDSEEAKEYWELFEEYHNEQ